MTSISIIGTGRAAALHAAACVLADHIELEGIVGRNLGSATELAGQAEVPELSLEQAITRSEAIVVAVPPADAPAVLASIGRRVSAVLVETPSAPSGPQLDVHSDDERPPTMIGANLLHAPITRRALQEIGSMNDPHHFALRSTSPRPDWGQHGSPLFGGGAILDPGCRLLPILMAALGAPVVSVSAELDADSQRMDTCAILEIKTDAIHQRDITVEVRWSDHAPTTSLEVAGDNAVVRLELAPPPTLEVNGDTTMEAGNDNPYETLGFTAQVSRLGAVARGDAAPWPDYSLASGLIDIATAAAFSSTHQGIPVSPGAGYAQRSVWNLLGGA